MSDSEDGGTPTTPDEVALAPETPAAPRRRSRAIALWGVLAIIALGAGALVVTSGDDDPPRLPIALGAGDGRSESAASPAAADMAMLAYVTYVAGEDLPLLGGSGPAYRLSGEVTEDQVRDLADALGVTGEPTEADRTWTVEGEDGYLQVYSGGGGNWWYTSEDVNAVSGGGSSGSSGSGVACEGGDVAVCEELKLREQELAPEEPPVTTIPVPVDLPSEDEARQIALDLFRELGVDVEDAQVTVNGPYDVWDVNIEPRIDGRLATGLAYNAAIGSGGEITSAGGTLNSPDRLGDYPVVDTRAAIDRLNTQMGGFGGGRERMAVEDTAGVASEEPTTTVAMPECIQDLGGGEAVESCHAVGCAASDTPAIAVAEGEEPVATTNVDDTVAVDPDTPVSSDDVASDPAVGAPADVCPPYVPPEPVEVVLHEAEEILVLMGAYDESGDTYLVPGYRMRGDDEHVVDVVAVDDESLLPQPEPPVEEPIEEPGVTDPGTSRCAEIPPGPDGAVPDICLDPNSTPPAEPTEPAEDIAPPVEAP